MGKNTNKIVSVKNHQNKTDDKKIRLEETNLFLPNSNSVCTSSTRSIYVNLCKEKNAKGYNKKNMQIFERLSNVSFCPNL